MTIALRYAARSDVGLIREGNEDAGYAGPSLLAIADGMGGHAAGEVASSIAVATIAQLDEEPAGADLLDALAGSIDEANLRLRQMVEGDEALEGMGTTLTALLFAGARVGIAHIGDSRAFLLRDGEFSQITHDHTFVQTLVDEGRISADEAEHHPQRSLLMRALDGRSQPEPDLSVRDVRPGDRYLVCSDGLSGVVSEDTMRDDAATWARRGERRRAGRAGAARRRTGQHHLHRRRRHRFHRHGRGARTGDVDPTCRRCGRGSEVAAGPWPFR